MKNIEKVGLMLCCLGFGLAMLGASSDALNPDILVAVIGLILMCIGGTLFID